MGDKSLRYSLSGAKSKDAKPYQARQIVDLIDDNDLLED